MSGAPAYPYIIEKTDFQALPASSSSFLISLAGVACYVLVFFWSRLNLRLDPVALNLLCLCAYAIPVIALEHWIYKVHRRPETGLNFDHGTPGNLKRVLVKILGLYSTLLLIALMYWLFPIYHSSSYDPYWKLLDWVLPLFLIAAIPYFYWIDGLMEDPYDGYWHAGLATLGAWHYVDKNTYVQHLLGWLVKAYFLPFMLTYMHNGLQYIYQFPLDTFFSQFKSAYQFSWEFLFSIDLVVGCTGYILTLRLLDSHARSTDSTLFGWMINLACYEPFWGLVAANYLNYNTRNYYWGDWLANHPFWYTVWGLILLALLTLYAMGTVAFGLRFSNLSHRGIVTGGPFRLTKHPEYVFKNILWWFLAIPFVVTDSVYYSMQACILLLGVNLIYFARAKSEERHLSNDPVYVQYALAMNDRSIFRRAASIIPALRYKPPI